MQERKKLNPEKVKLIDKNYQKEKRKSNPFAKKTEVQKYSEKYRNRMRA